MSEFIKFENVTFAYNNEDEERSPNVLENFNLTINKGEFVAILGHNGCGKSTVAKLCNGIETPLEGRVLVDGLNTADEDQLYDVRQKVGMVFQNPDNQIVATIVEDDVAFGPENLGVEPSEIRRRVDDSLKRVGMFDFRLFEPHKLSGGQKQRVAIAGIIAMQPECIVFDESTAMLDPQGRREVMETIRSFHEAGMTVVFITHYMDEAVNAERVIVMDGGRIVLDGAPREVFSHEDVLKKARLDVPQITGLSRMLRADGFDIPFDILSVEELTERIAALAGK